MTLHFRITGEDVIALIERSLHHSRLHQQTKKKVRWLKPFLMLLLALFVAITHTGSTPPYPLFIILAALAILSYVRYPRRYDAQIRNRLRAATGEKEYQKLLGDYSLTLSEEGMHSTGPLGSGVWKWTSVVRVELHGDYLFIFLAGTSGWAIRRSQIGMEVSEEACAFVTAHRGSR